jgi:hypothetical protein
MGLKGLGCQVNAYGITNIKNVDLKNAIRQKAIQSGGR